MLTGNELELKSNITLGELTSNAEEIKKFVTERVKDYTPENYQGRVKEAQADRAVLNNAEKMLNSKRLELERQYMAPFTAFKAVIDDTCALIKGASAKLDEIVKKEEQREKDEKFKLIEEYWKNTNFDLVDLEDVFISKWLNKGTKLNTVYADIDAAQKKILDELKVIEQFPEQDQALIKTVYLETLDISAAMDKANTLKANREKLARENKARQEIQNRARINAQIKDIKEDERENTSLDIIGEIIPETKEDDLEVYALEFSGKRKQLLELKEYMTKKGILYKKLTPAGDGVYTLEV